MDVSFQSVDYFLLILNKHVSISEKVCKVVKLSEEFSVNRTVLVHVLFHAWSEKRQHYFSFLNVRSNNKNILSKIR